MLHRTMAQLSQNLVLGLEDLLADLRHARRRDDLGRLATLSYCDVRRWARLAGMHVLAERASEIVTGCPHASRASLLMDVDTLIAEMERALASNDEQRPRLHS
jgi:hypothetical protein